MKTPVDYGNYVQTFSFLSRSMNEQKKNFVTKNKNPLSQTLKLRKPSIKWWRNLSQLPNGFIIFLVTLKTFKIDSKLSKRKSKHSRIDAVFVVAPWVVICCFKSLVRRENICESNATKYEKRQKRNRDDKCLKSESLHSSDLMSFKDCNQGLRGKIREF